MSSVLANTGTPTIGRKNTVSRGYEKLLSTTRKGMKAGRASHLALESPSPRGSARDRRAFELQAAKQTNCERGLTDESHALRRRRAAAGLGKLWAHQQAGHRPQKADRGRHMCRCSSRGGHTCRMLRGPLRQS